MCNVHMSKHNISVLSDNLSTATPLQVVPYVIINEQKRLTIVGVRFLRTDIFLSALQRQQKMKLTEIIKFCYTTNYWRLTEIL